MHSYIWIEYGGRMQAFHPPVFCAVDTCKELEQGLEELCQDFEASQEMQQEPLVKNFIAWHREHHLKPGEGDRDA